MKRIFVLFLLLHIAFCILRTPVFAETNLLTNPGFETADSTGWTPSGASVRSYEQGCPDWPGGSNAQCIRKTPNLVNEGEYSLHFSYTMTYSSQTVDLTTTYTTTHLDTSPAITATVYMTGTNYLGGGCGDTYRFRVLLKNGSGGTIATYDTNTQTASSCSWQSLTHTFTGYGTGVRSVYFEIGGMSSEYVQGAYGSAFDSASLIVADSTPTNTPTPTPTTFYTLSYTAGSNGSISGSTSQSVLPGGSGSSVSAVANVHYHFVNWSDASSSNPRTDTNVMSNISLTANFSIDTYSVTYSAGTNGSITGTTSQTINYGGDTTQVTAVADSGYHFTNWSDGSTANPRTDYNITTDKSVTANFAANDPDAPIISNVTSSSSDTSSTITWSTDEAASSQVQYGLNAAYGFSTTESDIVSRVTTHSVPLADLKACARYYYRVLSKDATNNQSASSQKTFNTLGCATSSIVNGSENLLPVSGGTVELVNNLSTAQLTIPDGYAAEEATFQINKLDTSAPPAGPNGANIAKGNLYELVAVTTSDTRLTSFATPLTFTISYGNDTESDYVESTLDIYKYNGSSWDKKNCALDTVANTLTCSLSGFSTYGVLGKPKETSLQNQTTTSSQGFSSPVNPTCDSTKPASFPDLFEINAGITEATIYFTPLSDTNTYFISFSEGETAESHGATATLSREGVQNYTVYKLKPNTRYYAKARGENGCMPGEWSNVMSFVTNKSVFYKNQQIDFVDHMYPPLISQSELIDGVLENSAKKKIVTFDAQKKMGANKKNYPRKKVFINKKNDFCILWWCL